MSLKDTLRAELRALRTWVSAAMIAALPFTSDIMSAVNANLPGLAPYLPETVYKMLGFGAVLFNIVTSVRATRAAASQK